MDKEELELKQKLKEEKKAILEARKKKRNESKSNVEDSNKSRQTSQKAIYISNISLDHDTITIREELIQEFGKFGDLQKNQDNEVKCKLYQDKDGKFKGDALIIYTREEYAVLAIEMMNDYTFKGNRLKVEMAHFEEKKPIEERKHEESKDDHHIIDDETQVRKRRKLGNPVEEDTNNDSRKERTLVLANIIDIYQDLESDELQEIEDDIVEGCRPFGYVISHTMNSDKGEIHVTFDQRDHGLKCRQTMNGRFFDGRKILAYMLDEEDLSDDEAALIHQEETPLNSNDDFIDDI